MLMRGSIIRWVVLFSGVFVTELVMCPLFDNRRRHYLRLLERYLQNALLGRDG